MRFARKSRVVNAVPTASMADIAFLLLIFFMVSTVFVRHRGLQVQLPEAEKIQKLENRRNVTSIWVDRQGVIKIDGQENVALDQVGKIVNDKIRANPLLIISIKGDGEAEFGLLSNVMQELRKAKALRVNFATEREQDE